MDAEDFMARYPVLYHLAADDSWPSIERNGLLSTQEILRRWQVPDAEAQTLLSRRRAEPVTLDHHEHGTAVLRDQHPLSEKRLAPALTEGMTVEAWLRMLNSFVFFFSREVGLRRLHSAYDTEAAVVLKVRTRTLVREHDPYVRLAGINTGNTMRRPAPRGAETFLPIRRYDHARRKVQEVAVRNPVTDLHDHLISVERWLPGGEVEQVT